MDRLQKQSIIKDLEKKMVLIVGPRQGGKTWLARDIGELYKSTVYLNYDDIDHRKIIHEKGWLPSADCLILDELHKMEGWKNFLKGVYDTKLASMRIIVTGSARMNIFTEVGDSLAGRYFKHHLFPLSIAELSKLNEEFSIDRLQSRGGFPEPYLCADDIDAARWRRLYIDSLLREDVLNFDNIQNIKAIKLIFEILRRRVGSPISLKAIAEDANLSPNTVKKYIQILEALYIVFRVTPYSKNIARSLLKEPKIYFFDNGLVEGDEGIVFENLVANCLLKHCMAKYDYLGVDAKLHYLRTKDQQEVDFALIEDNKIIKIIEAKNGNKNLSKSLKYFHKKYNLPAVQLVKYLHQERAEGEIEIRRAEDFLKTLLM